MLGRFAGWIDGQLGLARLGHQDFLRKIFPDHWSFMLGEVALYALVVLVGSGTYLVLFFHPSAATVQYDGAYTPMQGVSMSDAYASALHISFDVQAGLLMRQTHHWAALVFLGAISLHMLRVFFTGAFRWPRQMNWLVGCTLLTIAVFSGFTGYSMVDDLLSGTGLVIGYSVLLSLPVLGPWLAFLLFGGPVPNSEIIPRLYAIHVMIIPGLLALLVTIHLAIVWRQKHTNYPGPQRTNHTIVGTRFWPTYATKATGFALIVCGIIVALGAFVEINPVWLWGPYDAAAVSAGSQPDWYVGWLEGALRLAPAWDLWIAGYLVPNPFFSGALLALIILAGLFLWPFLEAWATKDHEVHHVLDRLYVDAPVRTAIGVAGVCFVIVLLIAGSDDVLAVMLHADIERIRSVLRTLAIGVPLMAALLTFALGGWLAEPEVLGRADQHRDAGKQQGCSYRGSPSLTLTLTPTPTHA